MINGCLRLQVKNEEGARLTAGSADVRNRKQDVRNNGRGYFRYRKGVLEHSKSESERDAALA